MYSVLYKMEKEEKFSELENVINDEIVKGLPFWCFHLVDGEMVLIPLNSILKFSKERKVLIDEKIKKERAKVVPPTEGQENANTI